MQKVFTENRKKLKSLGVDYPTLGTEFLLGHHNVAWSFMPHKETVQAGDFTIERFLSYIKTCESSTILISSEEFDFLKPRHIAKLSKLLSDFDVRIVVYLRQPLTALYSYWQEAVKHGHTTPFNDYCSHVLDKRTSLKYGSVLDVWSKRFGPKALSIVVYDNLLDDNQDIALYCLNTVLSLDTKPHDFYLPKSRVNKASDSRNLELIRQLNHIYKVKNNAQIVPQEFQNRSKDYVRTNLAQMDYVKALDNLFSYKTMAHPRYKPLYQFFHQLERRVMRKYGDRILNPETKKTMFKSRPPRDYKIMNIDAHAVQETLNMEAMYKEIISYDFKEK